MAREALALDAGEGAEGFRQRNLRAGPMQQQQIDLAEAEPRQTPARGAFKLAGREVRRPDLRGHEDLVAPDAGCTQALAHRLLVVVHLGGVEVTVTEAQRLLDHAGADAAAQFPGAETEQRNPRAVGVNDRCRFLRTHVLPSGVGMARQSRRPRARLC